MIEVDSKGVDLIAIERARQLLKWPADHDDGHDGGELALAAVCYAAPSPVYIFEDGDAQELRFTDPWPFDTRSDERTTEGDRVALLMKAGALIAAEIDRILRHLAEAGE